MHFIYFWLWPLQQKNVCNVNHSFVIVHITVNEALKYFTKKLIYKVPLLMALIIILHVVSVYILLWHSPAIFALSFRLVLWSASAWSFTPSATPSTIFAVSSSTIPESFTNFLTISDPNLAAPRIALEMMGSGKPSLSLSQSELYWPCYGNIRYDIYNKCNCKCNLSRNNCNVHCTIMGSVWEFQNRQPFWKSVA